MTGDMSVNAWYKWYVTTYKKHFYLCKRHKNLKDLQLRRAFKKELEKDLKHHINNANTRNDKNNDNRIVQQCIREQKNQIEALKSILKRMDNSYFIFLKYKIEAKNIEDFLKRYTKHDRHEGRGKDYAEARIKSYTEDFNKKEFCFMSHHESITGECVSYYGKKSL